MQAVRECDIVIAISNGNAGWANTAGEIGVCHAELMTGLAVAPAKVRLVAIDNIPIAKSAVGVRNQRFQECVDKQSFFEAAAAASTIDLEISTCLAVEPVAA